MIPIIQNIAQTYSGNVQYIVSNSKSVRTKGQNSLKGYKLKKIRELTTKEKKEYDEMISHSTQLTIENILSNTESDDDFRQKTKG